MPDSGKKIDGFLKRNGFVVEFHAEKIEKAIQHAFAAVARQTGEQVDDSIARTLTEQVIAQLNDPFSEYYIHPDANGRRIPKIEDVQDLVEIVLAENQFPVVVAAYKRYRKQRELARRKIRVRTTNGELCKDPTDASLLLVESLSSNSTDFWDRGRIINQLVDEIGLPGEIAISVAKAVENQVIESNVSSVNTALIRELVNNELALRDLREQLRDLEIYSVPKQYIDSLMNTKSTENSNIVNNNPEAVNLGIAELVLKQWALDRIFSAEVKRAHHTGMVHLHDLGYPHRVYCSSHSVEYVKKYGLQRLLNLNTVSKPARSATVLTGHLNTFLATMQANYAGALGIAYINVFYAPLLVGMSPVELKQIAQELIFNGSQNAFSRGGQTLFLDFNIHSGVPSYLKKVPAIGPGGKYLLRKADGTIVPLTEMNRDETDAQGYSLMNLVVQEEGRPRLVWKENHDPSKGIAIDAQVAAEVAERGEKVMTYGDYEKQARDFALALLQVWEEGDKNGRVFEFPKCDFHINEDSFTDPEQLKIVQRACEVASQNGSTYFIFDRDEVTLSACCRLRTTITDNRMLQHPESMRFCGFQNVTVNVPQAAFRAARKSQKDLPGLLNEIDAAMEICAQAHLQKRQTIRNMMAERGQPLYQIGQPSCDGKPYVDLDTCTYIIGLIGVNDAVKFLTGQELHESEQAQEMGLRIVAHMFLKAKKMSRKYKMKFSLEESPAESAARRLAKSDLKYFAPEATPIVKGSIDDDSVFYTNSIHLAADAPVSIVERIRQQAKYHGLIESGAIIHAFVGEEKPSSQSIFQLVEKTFRRTQCAQLTISPEFTYCLECHQQSRGLEETCPRCGSDQVYGETRVVGYFSKIENWNKSKRYGELVARQRGRYRVETAEESLPSRIDSSMAVSAGDPH
ncbi:MAG TPA: anaerobic ribonucleoside-triphosphate reductase [bacterium]|nr:anaerobic ribonucleoside-triphosphate reductase [bacterium]HPG44564.1 anaerobic ribonucleoside-triphosphate reductase [bacterium]HPM97122.1 anaerobic ribonucleoside-triphosphate reductase [bacterium]